MASNQNRPINVELVMSVFSVEGDAFKAALEYFANRDDIGGWPLEGDLRETANEHSLIYRCSGRLRPVPLKLLQGRTR